MWLVLTLLAAALVVAGLVAATPSSRRATVSRRRAAPREPRSLRPEADAAERPAPHIPTEHRRFTVSSIRFSASGQRPLSLTIGAVEATTAVVPSKPGDHANISLGSFQKLSVLLPPTARIELVDVNGSKMVRLTLGDDYVEGESFSYQTLTIEGRGALRADGAGMWPHVDVNVGKHLDEYVGALALGGRLELDGLTQSDSLLLSDIIRLSDILPPSADAE